MLEGTIKFYLTDKKYGFIVPSDGSQEVYVADFALENTVKDGDKVRYQLQEGRLSPVAEVVQLKDRPEA